MSAPGDTGSTRDRLLAATLAYAERHGVSELSLRDLARAIGTSHRMLIYHFGSKEGLLVAVVQAVEGAQRAFLDELAAAPDLDVASAIRAMWRRFSDPSLAPSERLFFDVYVEALKGRPGMAGFLDDVVDSWVDATVRQSARLGVPEDRARVDARLGVAVMRGLILDLLATGERDALDAALERYVDLYVSAAPGD